MAQHTPSPESTAAAAASLAYSNILLSVLSYSFCSGTLLILNKVLTISLPPGLIGCIQFSSTTVIVLVLYMLNVVSLDKSIFRDPFRSPIVRGYAKYSVLFLIGVYSNMRALAASNVDTVIVFRSSTPLLVCFLDMTFMGRAGPGPRSVLAMALMVVGAAAYVLTDAAFTLDGASAYFWVAVYYFAICCEMIFGKMLTRDLKCELGTSVLLTNVLTLPFMLLVSLGTSESWNLGPLLESPSYVATLFVSCCVGTGIGFASWWCRSLVSSTSFTVVGIVNKVLTVLLNIALWDKHSSPFGTFSLFLCLGGGVMYQQAPLVSGAVVTSVTSSSASSDPSSSPPTGGGEQRDEERAEKDREEVEALLNHMGMGGEGDEKDRARV